MDRAQIRAEWDKFIEYPSDDKSFVSTVSAQLFAEHIAKLKATQADHVPDAGEMVTQEPVQAGELPGAPERIWLQVNPEGDASDTGYPADHEGVTWCWHSIGGQEVEYVRADRAALSARKPLSGHEARELVSIHQKAVFELAKDMSDDNHKAVVSARLALLHELCPNGIGLEVKP